MKDNTYYVYIFLDQRYPGVWKYENINFQYKPFYVGRGIRNRINVHFQNNRMAKESHKNSTIKCIKKELGELPIHLRVYENLTNDEANFIEMKMIKHFGRNDIGTGILCNHTDGGESTIGCTIPHYSKRKAVYQYDLDGNFIRKWDSFITIKKELNFYSEGIRNSCRNKGTAYGFNWFYEYQGDTVHTIKRYNAPSKLYDIEKIDIKTSQVLKMYSTLSEVRSDMKLSESQTSKIADAANKVGRTAYGFKWRLKSK